ncbi:MAG: SH3 domain-containing protein [Firmicutes bacterium]|nr:SH3 domain-containing protein [Candidatus Fermentithermobacillaceae bacterium]
MEELLDRAIKQVTQLAQDYRELYERATGSTERELLGKMLRQKKFEMDALELLKSGRVPERFIAFGTVTDNSVNLREAPSTTSPVLLTLQQDTGCILMDRKGNWVNIQLYDGRQGWVFKDYVRASE